LRLDGIDVLRGLAVTAVVIYHFFILLGLTNNDYFSYINAFGLLGVPLFFVISGYLIYRSIDNSVMKRGKSLGVLNYFLHRIFRILPAYYFNLFFVLMMAAFMLDNTYLYSMGFVKQIITNMTFTSYFIHHTSGFGFNGAYWTLNIEMLWYLLAPLLLLFVRYSKILIVLGLINILYLWALSSGMLDSFFGLVSTDAYYGLKLFYYSSQIQGQLIFFISGIFIYKYATALQALDVKYYLWIALVLVVIFILIFGSFDIKSNLFILHMSILFVSTIIFILLYKKKMNGVGIVEWLGKISYSLYLWHMPLLFIIKKSEMLHFVSLFWTTIIFTLLLLFISSLSYYFIEEGGFTLRKKITERLFKK